MWEESVNSFNLKSWLRTRYSDKELEELYLNCVVHNQSIHSIFLDLLIDKKNISYISVALVISTLRSIHNENINDNK